MAEASLLKKVWTFLWKGVALILALCGGLILACLIMIVLPFNDAFLLIYPAILTIGAVVYMTAKALWGRRAETMKNQTEPS